MTSSSLGFSRETLGRGVDILQSISDHGVVKEELPEDERQIIDQIQDCKNQNSSLVIPYYMQHTIDSYQIAFTQELKERMMKLRQAKEPHLQSMLSSVQCLYFSTLDCALEALDAVTILC